MSLGCTVSANPVAWIHHWERVKKWKGFGDLDPIFKVAYELRISYIYPEQLACTLSPKQNDGFRPNLVSYVIGMGKRRDSI